ncbi:hypothetical protein LTR40_013988, partial [Exophiala xenobiotica]
RRYQIQRSGYWTTERRDNRRVEEAKVKRGETSSNRSASLRHRTGQLGTTTSPAQGYRRTAASLDLNGRCTSTIRRQ